MSPATGVMADPDLILTQLLATSDPDIRVSTELPADVMTRLPWVRVVGIPSASAPEPRLQLRALVQVDAWANSRVAAADLCRRVVLALDDAWSEQRVVPAGHLRRLELSNGPGEIRESARSGGQPDGVWRFTAQLVGIFRAT